MINEKEIRVVGMQRSGNHPIIDWIMSMCDEPSCYLNFVKEKNPFTSCVPQETTLKGMSFSDIELINKKCLVYSFEDEFLRNLPKRYKGIGKSKKMFNILVLRDPYNLFASRLKRRNNRIKFDNEKQKRLIINMWKEHAKEFLNESGYLNNKISINFNKWFLDEKYRKEIAKKMKLKYNDESLDRVSDVGAGSSFDCFDYDYKAKEMKVLERWKYYNNNNFYNSLFDDNKLIELSDKIFGVVR